MWDPALRILLLRYISHRCRLLAQRLFRVAQHCCDAKAHGALPQMLCKSLHVVHLRGLKRYVRVLPDEVCVPLAHSCRRLTGHNEYSGRGICYLLVTIRSWSSLQRISGLEATRMEPAACMYTMYGDGFTTLRALHAHPYTSLAVKPTNKNKRADGEIWHSIQRSFR